MTRPGSASGRWPLWLSVCTVSVAALWAVVAGRGRQNSDVPSARAASDVHGPELAPREPNSAARVAALVPALAAGESRPRAPGSDPAAPAALASLSGRVLDALGGPIAGAAVHALGEHSATPLATTLSRADGGFELRTPPGPLRVVAQAEGYSTELRRAVAPAGSLTLSLAPATRIFGRVSDAAGAPVSGAIVRARALLRLEAFDPSVATDAAGGFHFDALGAGEYELRASGERLSGEPERVSAEVADELGPIELRVARAARVTLAVERGGRACAGGWVQLSGARFADAREISEGRVRFEGVPMGDYQLGLGCEQAAVESRVLRVGEQDIDETMVLDPQQAVRGRVLDSTGAGVAGVLVTVSPTGLPEERAQLTCPTGPNGDFLCEGLRAGGYLCNAGLELQPQSDTVELQLVEGAASAPVLLSLWPRAQLVVSLEHVPEDRLSGVQVSARPPKGPPLTGERRGSEFHFDGLLLGAYAVYLAASPGTRRDVVLERDGQRLDISLSWPKTRAISGVVLDERNQPAAEVWVHAAAAGAVLPFAVLTEAGVPALSDSAGRFTIEGLFEGRYHLRVESLARQAFARGVSSGTQGLVLRLAAPREASEAPDGDETDPLDPRDSIGALSGTVQRAP